MNRHALALATVAALLATSACSKSDGNGTTDAQTPAAEKVAGDKTIAAGLPADSKFMAAAKAAGLDQTLAGPGPYTVLVPDDAAITGAGDAFNTDPSNRAQLTGAITNLILPGTVLVEDINRAIDKGKGKDVLATVGGGTLTATKEGGRTVLTDSTGRKATISKGDELFSNGVVHRIDAVLMPSKQAAANTPAVGDKAGQ
ncbi:MAG: fasciclin domain-containing protein [Pseudomonadota bacterium]